MNHLWVVYKIYIQTLLNLNLFFVCLVAEEGVGVLGRVCDGWKLRSSLTFGYKTTVGSSLKVYLRGVDKSFNGFQSSNLLCLNNRTSTGPNPKTRTKSTQKRTPRVIRLQRKSVLRTSEEISQSLSPPLCLILFEGRE